ncbi:hypothetical protein LSAT2_002909 [Lamellibrachia satsuma]|nr:hypothetical protein LSAT2_002909 [Lamellibrachia satsuma]
MGGKLATGDTNLHNLTRVSITLAVYAEKKVKVTAFTTLQVHRNGRKHNLHFKVMSGKHYQPLLSCQACVGIGALKWNDAVRRLAAPLQCKQSWCKAGSGEGFL